MINLESIINLYAFKIGICIYSIMLLLILINLLMAKFYQLRILEVSIFYAFKKYTLSSKIQHIVLQIGWIPTSYSLKFDVDETGDNNLPYTLNSKSYLERFIIFIIPAILFIIIGSTLLSLNQDAFRFLNSFMDLFLFQQSINQFIQQNQYLITNLHFTTGLIFLICGLSSLTSNSSILLRDSKYSIFIVLLTIGIALLFIISISKIFWFYFSISNLASYLAGTYLIGIVAYLIFKQLLKILPHY